MRTDESSNTYKRAYFCEASLPMNDAGRLIFVTNRGPIEHRIGKDGTLDVKRGAGGVVSGLLCASSERPISWISVAMTDGDRRIAQERAGAPINAPAGLANLSSRLVYIPERVYHRYYDNVSNHLLWFAQHGMLTAQEPYTQDLLDNWQDGYVAANRAIAHAVIAELQASGDASPVMFHDYHLYLVPAMVRAQAPTARLQHFVHIPWPTADDWMRIPDRMVRQIYEGLAANDVIGFQTARDVRHFLEGVSRYLPGARISRDPDELHWQGRRILVRAYPIALTPASVEQSARSRAAQEQAQQLRKRLRLDTGRKLLVRVDRVEPTKNIVRGFEAYERLLCEHAEWRERIVFLSLLVPSRESLPEYRRYAAEVKQSIARINDRFGTPEWQPIVAIFGNDRARALACMQDYDVLLVNPLVDGMNLVAKEGGLLNRRDGVLVLSEGAGAYAYLRNGVLGISATDVEGTAEALHTALIMPQAERARLGERLRATLHAESAELWLRKQLADLMRVTGQTVEAQAPKVATVEIPAPRHPLNIPVSARDTTYAPTRDALVRSHTPTRFDGLATAHTVEPVPVLTQRIPSSRRTRPLHAGFSLPDVTLLEAIDGVERHEVFPE